MRVLLIFILGLALNIYAQDDLSFNFDYAQFSYDSTSNYVELYYSFDKNKLSRFKANGMFYVSALLHVTVKNIDNGENLLDKNWRFKDIVNDSTDNEKPKSTLGVLGFIIPAGIYDLSVSITDAENDSIKSFSSEKLTCTPFVGKKFKISDIQLASNIIVHSEDTTSLFYKNTFEVIPNPAILYSNASPVVFYYAELYNLKNEKNDNIELVSEVINSIGEVVYKKNKAIPCKNNSIVEVGLVNMSHLPTDAYILALALRDSVENRQFISSKKFFFYNPGVKPDSGKYSAEEKYIGSEFGVYTEKECDRLFDESKYIATDSEIGHYKKLNSLNAKRDFLYKFWKKRDPIPETEVNEFKNEYIKRINYVNSHFKAFNKEGYKTDRGRIYLQYGPPDQIDRHPNEIDLKPYEIWQYQAIEGGVVFVFGDITGYSDYELLHSTKRGELRDDNWERRIRSR